MSSNFDIYNFQSIGYRYTGTSEPDLQLALRHHGDNAIEIELKNKRYFDQRQQKAKQLLVFLALFLLYCGMAHCGIKLYRRSIFADLGFMAYFIYLVVTTMKLTKKEKLIYCADFAMQIETESFLGRRSSFFISATDIHDVCINEVIENIDIHYILIVRTRGNLFEKQPIITLFNTMRPTLDCLELIYRHLNKILQRQSVTSG